MIACSQLRAYVIRPVLREINLYSEAAEEVLVATCANESLGGTYLHQVKGPALGIYQMEGNTHTDIWQRYLKERGTLTQGIMSACNFQDLPEAEDMVWNLQYATLMARVFYLRFPERLPEANDFDGIWQLYKQRYNTPAGKATKEAFLTNYQQFIKT